MLRDHLLQDNSDLPRLPHVLPRRRVAPHPRVHARAYQHRPLPEVPRHADARHQVVAGAVDDLLTKSGKVKNFRGKYKNGGKF